MVPMAKAIYKYIRSEVKRQNEESAESKETGLKSSLLTIVDTVVAACFSAYTVVVVVAGH